MKTSRRDFFKVGLLGSAVLLAGSSLSALALVKNKNDNLHKFDFLSASDAEFLLSLTPVILKDNYPTKFRKEADHRLLLGIDKQISSLGDHSKKQLRQLFDLLTLSALRFLAGAPSTNWPIASSDQIESFLNGWKKSLFTLKRTGYTALVKLVMMSWYAQPENYSQAGYPGPPKTVPPQE